MQINANDLLLLFSNMTIPSLRQEAGTHAHMNNEMGADASSQK